MNGQLCSGTASTAATRRGGGPLVSLFILLFAIFLIAGCAAPTRLGGQKDSKNDANATLASWAGRISLQVNSEPAQSFSASFELTGRATQGALTLISPLGNVLGVLRWSPDEAMLDTGKGELQRYASVEEFMRQATGAAVPVAALFAWLQGQDPQVEGWTADLSRHAQGRIAAQRNMPLPTADLRLVIDPPT